MNTVTWAMDFVGLVDRNNMLSRGGHEKGTILSQKIYFDVWQ